MRDDSGMLPFPAHDDAAEALANGALAAQVTAMYAATPVADAGAAERCATAILAEHMRAPTRGVGDASRPRWWWGAAAAVVVVAALATWRTRSAPLSPATGAGPSIAESLPTGQVTPVAGGDAIRFDLKLPLSAKAVAIVGDFNGWDAGATPMRLRDGKNSWSAQVELEPGRHVYAFVVDGTRWLVDPLAPQVSDEGFGPSNAVLVEGSPQ